ncbi:MAG: hypothetical protein U5K75_03435 [Ahrensia sp.]|nr:hypothetical protein [Ahrensia sp.]
MFKNLFAKKPSNKRTAKALAHEETLRVQAEAKARAQVVLKRLEERKAAK